MWRERFAVPRAAVRVHLVVQSTSILNGIRANAINASGSEVIGVTLAVNCSH